MKTDTTSLRSLVEKWIPPPHTASSRVMRFGQTTRGVRYVRVEVLRPSGPLHITFCCHDDGAWQMFPPAARRPQMKALYLQASEVPRIRHGV